MNTLTTTCNFNVPDDYYECLIDAHRDLSTEQSHAMNAALVLLLSNHIGDLQVVQDALGSDHATMAVLVWAMLMALAAACVAFLLAGRPRVLRALAPWVRGVR